MNNKASPGVQLFVGVGWWIVAWSYMPAPDWHPMTKFFVAVIAIVGAMSVIGSIVDGARRAGLWWQGLGGRIVVVGALWLGIVAAGGRYGTPHILYEYPPRQPVGSCVYFGWNGFVRSAARGDGEANGCRAIEWQ